MRKFYLLFLFIAIFASTNAQSVNVTATLGTLNGSYPTLKAAFDKINDGTHQGTVTINVIGNTTEAVSAILNASGGTASYTSVNIQPSGGAARIISGSLAAPLIDLNGADNVTIDGLNTGGNALTISNASTSSLTNTSSIRFISGATGNTIINCNIEGSGTNAALGTILFSTGTGAGNDGNIIMNNTITSAGGNLPFNAIFSAGSSTVIDNSGIAITNNNIQDYYNPIGASNGILVASNSSAWTISGNKFFQTATRTATAGTTSLNVHRAINIVTASGVNYTISNNIIGYANASGTGTTSYDGAFTNRFVGIEITGGIATASNVQGNIVAGISVSTTSGLATAPGIFSGISILAGSVNIGTTTGNTVGSTTGTGSISITSTTSGGYIAGIYAASTGTVSIQNNNIGSIATGGSALIGYTFYGIHTAGAAGNFTVSSNTVGSATTANAVTIGTDAVTNAVATFNGITNSSTGTTSVSGNTIQNCSVYSAGASVFNGLTNAGSTGILTITTNNIISGTNTGNGGFTCISNAAAAAIIYIDSNVIRSHTRTAGSGAFIGITNTGAAITAINIIGNQLGNASGGALTFTNATTGTITGIANSGGTATTTVTISNNTLQGFSVVSSGTFTGISNAGATGIAVNINNNQIGTATVNAITYTAANAAAATITGIVNSGGTATAAISINTNILLGFSGVSSGAFIGIYNTGAGSAITINYNQLGNTSPGALTFTSASPGAITGIYNNAGTATTTVTISNNTLQGFSVVSSGTFTGISNAGVTTGVAININNNLLGTTTGNAITFSGLNTAALVGISNTGGSATCALSIQSNDFRGIVHSVAGTSPHTYIINSAATLSQNISTNTFTSLDVNTTGAILFISDNVIVSATGIQHVDGNSIVGSFNRTNTSVSGTLTLFSSLAASVAGGVITNNNNNFSNITVSGAATILGWINTDAGAGTKNIQGNTFSNWTGGTGAITAMNISISGTGNATTGNNITNFNSGGNITAITSAGVAGAGNDNIYSNTINSISSTGAGSTLVNGIVVTAGTTKNIYQNTISALKANFNNVSGNVDNSLAVNGIWISGGTTVNVNQNIIFGCTADAIDAGTLNGITVSAGGTGTIVTLSRNKIYNLSSNSTAINAGGISGILVFSGTGSVTNIINNMIADIRTPVSGNSDALRGISLNVNTVSNINVYFNTIYLTATSSALNFGCSGIYHLSSSNPLVGQLDLRNNIINNFSTPTGTSSVVVFRQYATALNNYASVSNNNLFYAGTPGPKNAIYNDFSTSDQTVAAFQARLNGNRDSLSFAEDLSGKFISLAGSSPYFLHIDTTKCTRVESGGVNINGITVDYDGQTRQGNPGYIGTGSAPDLGADEFEGSATPRGILAGTTTICKGSAATLSLWSTGAGTLSGTLSDGTAFSGTAPTIAISVSPNNTTTYTISTLTNGTCLSNSVDKTGSAIVTVSTKPTGVLSGTATMCNGGSTNLKITATGTGTISGTLSDGTAFSGTAPTITISVAPSTTTTYTISTLTNGACTSLAADKTGSATITVSTAPSASIAYSGSPFCSNTGSADVTFSGTPGGTYSSTPGSSINSNTGRFNLAGSLPGKYTITYTVAASGGCAIYTTSAVIIIGPNTWTGGISTDWNTAGNWISNAVPTMNCSDVTILANEPFQPTLGSGKFAIQNLFINPGAILTITNATLQIAGTINNSGTFDVSNGSIEINGSATQAIPANAFSNNALKDLIISNSSAGGVVLGGALDIYGSLTFTGAGRKLITNDVLTLKSTSIKTANVGDVTGNTITGKVTVERYISAHKAWRFLSVPTNTAQTVKQTWQEGAAGNNSNPVLGYGAQITGAAGTDAGFDLYSATPSMKTYSPANNTWIGIANTTTTLIKSTVGYMTFIRGDRTANAFNSVPTETVLRTKGDLYTGDQTPITVGAGTFTAIGNPYASALDMRKITTAGLKEFFYLWDPKLGGANGLGAYQTFYNDGNGNYEATPGMGSYGAMGSANNNIESGQAFFVQAATSTAGSLTFKEDAKTSGGTQHFARTGLLQAQLRTSLYGLNADNSTYVIDGVLNSYGDNYSDSVDDMDAIKSANVAENLSIKRTNTLLVVERRQSITAQDTIFLNLTSVKAQKYRFEFTANQLDQKGITGFLLDSYLQTSTPLNLNGSTIADFTIVNIPGSYAANRFSIVFAPSMVLPVTFASVKAYQQNKDIAVEWKAENESNLKQYDVEKSVDGNHYAIAHTVAANNAAISNYSWLDLNPSEGNNYYRVRSTDINGKTAYSTIVKVYMGKAKQSISVYPNPVVNGTINLQLANQPSGVYGIRLMNKLGQVMMTKQINHAEGSSTETIQLERYSPHGIYQLEVTKPDATNINITVIY